MAITKEIVWDAMGEKVYETGVSKGVLYSQKEGKFEDGVAWNGLTNADENPSGAEPTALYADNIKYAEIDSNEEFGLTIQAFTYPNEFNKCIGIKEVSKGVTVAQQTRASFGFAYRTEIGNDEVGLEFGYKLHLVYGAKAKPSARPNQTIGENPDVTPFSWEVSTTPVTMKDGKPTAHIVIDSRTADDEKLKELEAILYGSTSTAARLPLPDEVKELFGAAVEG